MVNNPAVQKDLEQRLRMTKAEGDWINAHPDAQCVQTLATCMQLYISAQDRIAFTMAQCAMEDVREAIKAENNNVR